MIEDKINFILDKIKYRGLDTLSNHEKKILKLFREDQNNLLEEEAKRFDESYKTSKFIIRKFGVNYNGNSDLWFDIGRYIKFKQKNGLIEDDFIFEIVELQKIYDESVAYRVVIVGQDSDLGRPARPSDVMFVDLTEEEAMEKNKEIFNNISTKFAY